MSDPENIWFVDRSGAVKRRVRIEVIGKSFALYEQQERSEAYFFDDLVYRGREGGSHVFGIEDGIKERPDWKLGFRGDIPAELTALLPRAQRPMISAIGMLIIASLCLAIVYFALAS